MSGAVNATRSDDIDKRLRQINETLSSISAKEVLFIITLSLLSIFVAIILCLQIVERRKKQKQNCVPQSIVIQPNTVKGDNKSGRHEKSKKMTSACESDVLPSKSMKMKVAISPSMASRKARVASSKEMIPDDSKSEMSKTESAKASQVEKKSSKVSLAPVTMTTTTAAPGAPGGTAATATTVAEPDLATAVEGVLVGTVPGTAPGSIPVSTASAPPTSGPSTAPNQTSSSASRSNDSMTSFTVPEEATSNRTMSLGSIFPKNAQPAPATPTATTLSGTSATSAPAGDSSASNKASSQVETAKELTAPASKVATPMTPVRLPDLRSPSSFPPPATPTLTTPPPPGSEKKI